MELNKTIIHTKSSHNCIHWLTSGGIGYLLVPGTLLPYRVYYVWAWHEWQDAPVRPATHATIE